CSAQDGRRCARTPSGGTGTPHKNSRRSPRRSARRPQDARSDSRSVSCSSVKTRLEERLDVSREDIADATLGPDEAWLRWIGLQLAAEAQHLNVDAAIEDVLVSPRRLQQVLARQRPARCGKKGDEKVVLALRERDVRPQGIGQGPCLAA